MLKIPKLEVLKMTTQNRVIETPTENDRREMAGRMYEAFDIARAIDSGQVKTIEDLLNLVTARANNLGKALEADKWIYTDCSLDINKTLEFKQMNLELNSIVSKYSWDADAMPPIIRDKFEWLVNTINLHEESNPESDSIPFNC